MASDIDRLRHLYIKYDSLSASGDDVVADLRKEINNLELAILRDSIIPKVAGVLQKEATVLRCSIDCNIQSAGGKIEYSFCTDNSPLVRATLKEENNSDYVAPTRYINPINSDVLNKLSSSIVRLSELTSQIEECKAEALKCITELKEKTSTQEERTSPAIEKSHLAEIGSDKILYCRSKTCNALGRLIPNGEIIILKGSLLREDTTTTYGPKEYRADLLEKYCSLTENGYMVLSDLPPMSVSGASGLCLGRSSNGNVDWKDEHGFRLGDLKLSI